MRRPLRDVLRRGAIFIWHRYSQLDDPAYDGLSKAKFIIVISSSPLDDPILYILTTSQKDDDRPHPFVHDTLLLPQGMYACFSKATLIDASGAGDRDLDRVSFEKFYAHML